MKLDIIKQKIIILIFFYSLTSAAQLKDSFQKGWIVKNNNIKIEGFIKKADLSMLSSSLCFKQKLETEDCTTYTTSQLKGFEIENGSIFKVIEVKINNNQENLKVFANLIVDGDALSLYESIFKTKPLYILTKEGKNYVLQDDEIIPGETTLRKYNYNGKLNFITKGFYYKNNFKTKFDKDNFINVVTEYNKFKNAKSKDLRVIEKSTNYVLINAGLGFKNEDNEYYGQIMYRKYYPSISRSTSINIGLAYFNYKYKEGDKIFSQSLLSVPFQIQQNFSNKKARPYIFAGLSLNYLQVNDESGNAILDQGLQETYGVNLLYGLGIEIDIYKGFYLKSEYREEAYSHPILFGIGYIF